MSDQLKDKLIDINIKTKGTQTNVVISTIGTIGTVTAALVGSALITRMHQK